MWGAYERRVDWHHSCADNSNNSYPGQDVRMFDKSGRNITVDLFDESRQLACEVKISFKNSPYDPYIRQQWLNKTLAQLATQKAIADQCGWKHCLIVNKPWMVTAFANSPYDVRLSPSCGSANGTLPDAVMEETPNTPLDDD